jgi:hypothetical protein
MANGKIGYGEACLPAYLGETTDGTLAFLELAKPILKQCDFSFTVPAILKPLLPLSQMNLYLFTFHNFKA